MNEGTGGQLELSPWFHKGKLQLMFTCSGSCECTVMWKRLSANLWKVSTVPWFKSLNQLKQLLCDFISLLHYCGGILARSSLEHCSSSSFAAFIYQSHHSISIRLRSGLWLGHCNSSTHSVVDLLLCLGSMSSYMTQFQPSFCRGAHTFWLSVIQVPMISCTKLLLTLSIPGSTWT